METVEPLWIYHCSDCRWLMYGCGRARPASGKSLEQLAVVGTLYLSSQLAVVGTLIIIVILTSCSALHCTDENTLTTITKYRL